MVISKVDIGDNNIDNTNLENADIKKAFADEVTEAKDITDDFEASVDDIGLDE
ncbi:28389_t:CDS:1, partial [Racocetra persica]